MVKLVDAGQAANGAWGFVTQHQTKRRYYDGAKIHALRVKRGMSMAALAKKCFLTDATISNLEHEVSEDPGHKVLMDLAAALGVTLDKIMRAPESSTPGDDLKAMFNVLSPDQQSAILSTVQHLLEKQSKK